VKKTELHCVLCATHWSIVCHKPALGVVLFWMLNWLQTNICDLRPSIMLCNALLKYNTCHYVSLSLPRERPVYLMFVSLISVIYRYRDNTLYHKSRSSCVINAPGNNRQPDFDSRLDSMSRQLWDPLAHLYNWYLAFFLRVKQPECKASHWN